MRRSGRYIAFSAGQVILVEKEPIAVVPLIEHGRVRATRASADGAEITPYEIRPGETCGLVAPGRGSIRLLDRAGLDTAAHAARD